MRQTAFGLLDSHTGWHGWEAAAHGPADAVTIPDAHLLFSGNFQRAGTDLILSDETQRVVVHDYFRGEHHPTLLSPDGASLGADVVDALTGHGAYAQAAATPNAVVAVGRVAKVEGSATIVRNGVAITVNTGDAVLKGDVLQTGAGVLGVTFADGSTLSLTANSRLMVNDFVYDSNGSANSEILNLVQGSLSFISGEVAHSGGNMKITTPVATMGIRGTVGGVSEASDGTVSFFVVESATGAVVTDAAGHVLFQVVQDGPLIRVRPAGPLEVVAEEVQKSPQELAAELVALQQIVNTQAIGQQIIQHFQDLQNNQGPHSTGTDHTQIQIDIPKSAFTDAGAGGGGGGTQSAGNTATVTTTTTDQNGNTTTKTDQVPYQTGPTPTDTGKSVFWTGGGGDSNSANNQNWSPGTPGGNDDVTVGSDQSGNPVNSATVTAGNPFSAHSLTLTHGAQLVGATTVAVGGDIAIFGNSGDQTGIFGDLAVNAGADLFMQATTGDAVIVSSDSLSIGSMAGTLTVEIAAGQCGTTHSEISAAGPDLTFGQVGGSVLLSAAATAINATGVAEITSGHVVFGNVGHDFTVEAVAGQCASAKAEILAAGHDLTIGTIGGAFLLSAAQTNGSAIAEIFGGNVTIGDVTGNFTVTGGANSNSSTFAEISATINDVHLGNIGGNFLNQGLIDADNGVLSIGTVGGTFVNDGVMRGYEFYIAPGDNVLDNNGTIVINSGIGGGGGNDDTSTVGVDVHNGGLIKVTDTVLDFDGRVQNFDCGVILASGGSEIDFNHGVSNSALIKASYGGEIDFNAHVFNSGTIEATYSSPIHFSCGGVDNCGLIEARHDGGIVFYDSVFNYDTIAASYGGEIDFHGNVHNSGTIEAASCGSISFQTTYVDNCGIIAANAGGRINFDHWVGGNGALAIAGGTIELASGTCNYVQFCGPDGTLLLDDASASIGEISGFGPGDTIDFTGIQGLSIIGFTADDCSNTGVLELYSSRTGNIFLSFAGDDSSANFSNYSAANFVLTTDGAGGTDITERPLIDVLNQNVETDPCDITTVKDFSIVAPFAGNDLLTITAQAGHGTLAFVNSALNADAITDTISETATIAQINAAFADGIVYTPTDTQTPEIDNVVMTINDNHGGTETINLIFKAAETTGGVTFEATTANDVIYGTETGADTFVYQPATIGGSDVIVRFSPTDTIAFLNEDVTIAGYQDNGGSGVLDLVLQPVAGGASSHYFLTFAGQYDANDFVGLFNGSETLIYDQPPGNVGGAGNGIWSNSTGGHWSVAGNWSNNAVPGINDQAVLTNLIGNYTTTFDGNVDGLSGFGMASAESLAVDSGITLDMSNHGQLFLLQGLQNDGTIDVFNSAIVAGGDGSNAVGKTITVEGTSGLVSSTFDINGAFANSGTVTAGAGGEASFGSLTGSGQINIDGGVIAIDDLERASIGEVVDTNDIAFTGSDGNLILGAQGDITGHISGFDLSDNVAFLNEQVTVTGYQDNGDHTGTLTLHLHPLDIGNDSTLSLLMIGDYTDGEFVTQFDGLNSLLYDRPAGVVQSGTDGVWTNAAGGDWGVAGNWHNDVVPGSGDQIVFSNVINSAPASYTATFDGAVDGLPGHGIGQVASLAVDGGVTFHIFNRGSLFLDGALINHGMVDADGGEILAGGDAVNTGTILIHGTSGPLNGGSIVVMGALANTGTVTALANSTALFASVTGTGTLSVAGGSLTIDNLGQASNAQTVDTNDISFDAANAALFLGGQGQIAGNILNFGVDDTIGFLNENVTITSYVGDNTHGVLTLHLHSLDGGGDGDLSLNLQGSYDRADFFVVHGGENTFLLEKPPGTVQSGLNGVWSNAAGGDWGTASNWHNNVVPGIDDDILLSAPVSHTVTFNGAIDGVPGYGFANANSLSVAGGVTFQVTNRGQLFFAGALSNSGSVDVVNSGLSFGVNGTNSGLITIEGTTGVISSTFDMDNGTLANSGTVDAKARGDATIRSVTGNGLLKVDGGVLTLGGADVASGQTIDTNEIQFAAANGLLLLEGQGQVAGHISGFGASDSVGFTDEQVTVTGYNSGTGVLQLHLHSLGGLGDHNLSLSFDGLSAGNFTAQFDGLNSLLYFNPIPAPVHGGAGAGVWSNALGGDWGVAGNWTNSAVPSYSDDITLNFPVGHTVTFNGASDGLSGFATAGALTVGAGVTFQVMNGGHLFFADNLHNGGAIDVLDAGVSVGGSGDNSDTIDVHGTFSFISSTFDIAGTFANSGTVVAGDHGSVGLAAITGTGVLVIDGGAMSIDGADANNVEFSTVHTGTLLLGDAADFHGFISGFAPVVNFNDLATAPAISVQNFGATSVNYVDNGNHTGVLHLHNGGTDIALNFDGDYTTANFQYGVTAGGVTDTLITDQGPVIHAAQIEATDNGGSTTLAGLSIADLFDSADHLTFTMTAGAGTLTPANSNDLQGEVSGEGTGTLSATASLSDIDAALSHGIVYTPNASNPLTDTVSIKIEDGNHAIDEVNLVFNQAGPGPNVTLTGGAGKDVVVGTGYNDTLTGGASSDTFVFREFGNSVSPNADTITDFNVFQDYLNFDQAHFATTAALLAATTDVSGHAVITVRDFNHDTIDTIALTNVTTAQLAAHQDHILLAA